MSHHDWEFDPYDDREADPAWEDFDRIIPTASKKATLFGYKDKLFWLPNSVHSIERQPQDGRPGVVIIEHWASYHKFPDPERLPKLTGMAVLSSQGANYAEEKD